MTPRAVARQDPARGPLLGAVFLRHQSLGQHALRLARRSSTGTRPRSPRKRPSWPPRSRPHQRSRPRAPRSSCCEPASTAPSRSWAHPVQRGRSRTSSAAARERLAMQLSCLSMLGLRVGSARRSPPATSWRLRRRPLSAVVACYEATGSHPEGGRAPGDPPPLWRPFRGQAVEDPDAAEPVLAEAVNRHRHGTTRAPRSRDHPDPPSRAARHDQGTTSRATIKGPPPPERRAPRGAPSARRPHPARPAEGGRVQGLARKQVEGWVFGMRSSREACGDAPGLGATRFTGPWTRTTAAWPPCGGVGYAAGSVGFCRFRYDSPSTTRS